MTFKYDILFIQFYCVLFIIASALKITITIFNSKLICLNTKFIIIIIILYLTIIKNKRTKRQ